MKKLLYDLIDFLLPPSCHVCNQRLAPNERFICSVCASRLPRTLYHTQPTNPMVTRFAGVVPFVHATGHFFYSHDGEMARLIHDFKYRQFKGIAIELGALMGRELITTSFLADVDAIMPVPIHIWRRTHRGYNQSEEIARGISGVTGIPVITNLSAAKPHRTQTNLNRAKRLANTSGIFQLQHPEQLAGKHIVILDDVCTTGATLLSAAEATHCAAPTARISLLSLAVTF